MTERRQKPSPRSGVSLPAGNHPQNTGGKKGRSGRKSKAFLARCVEATEDDELWREAKKKSATSVLQMAAAYVHGQPKQAQRHEGDITIHVVYDEAKPIADGDEAPMP